MVYLLAKYADLTVNGQSQAILTILVIGAGTDYALLLVARYREELRRHEDRHEAMAFALHRAAPAILASAATVVVSMLCLSFAELNSTAGLGPVLAVGVAVTFLVMVTLLPALLVIFGRWIFWPKRPTFGSPEPTTTGLWARVGESIRPRPRVVWTVTAGLLAVAWLGLFQLDASGLTTEDSYTKEFDSVVGQKVLNSHGLADNSNTVQITANIRPHQPGRGRDRRHRRAGTAGRRPAHRRRSQLLRGHDLPRHLLDGRVRRPSRTPAPPPTASPAPMHSWAVDPRSTSTRRGLHPGPTRSSSRSCWSWCS